MNEQEFVSKVINDKAFLATALESIPDDVMAELEAKGKAQRGQQQGADLGPAMLEYFGPAAKAQGYTFDAGVLASEFEAQMKDLGGFAKVKFLGRFVRSAAKATRKRKKRGK